MELANQTFYLTGLIVLLGLMAGFFSRHESHRATKYIFYWPLGILFLAISMAAFFAASWGGQIFLGIANISLIGGVISIAALFKSWRHSVGRLTLPVAILILLAASAMYVHLLINGTTSERIYLMNGVLAILACWQLYELMALIDGGNTAYQIKLLIGIQFMQIIVRLLRSTHLYFATGASLQSLYQEGGIGFWLRVVSNLLLLITCVLITNYYLERLWQEHRNHARAIENGMLHSLNALSMVRDNETGNHIVRTQHYVERLGKTLKMLGSYVDQLSDTAIEDMRKAAPLHDIGKVGIPDGILKKEGGLTEEEWGIMKTHASLGQNVLSAAQMGDVQHAGVLDVAIEIAGSHHENWDGSGYPRGLKGFEIPLSARIMALADMYDALVSERVYKHKWTHEQAYEEIVGNKGKRFDPLVVEAFVHDSDYFNEIANRYSDS